MQQIEIKIHSENGNYAQSKFTPFGGAVFVGEVFRKLGNPGYRQLDHLKETLSLLPPSVRKVRLRSDSAGYQTELLKYCANGSNERFGVIEFCISCPVSVEFINAVYKYLGLLPTT